jgi:hypothetical protein
MAVSAAVASTRTRWNVVAASIVPSDVESIERRDRPTRVRVGREVAERDDTEFHRSTDLDRELALGVLTGQRGERLRRLRELVGLLDGDA